MKSKFKGSKTEQMIINAFAGESMARNKYTFYAKQAKDEGYEQIAEIFLITAENEKEHAEHFYEHIKSEKAPITATYPFELGNTQENLTAAIEGEHEEHTKLYADGEKTAKEEGFDEISELFKQVRRAEEHHEGRFRKLLENVTNNTVFKKDYETDWMCRKCGYVLNAKEAPEKCPNCKHARAYFQIKCEEY